MSLELDGDVQSTPILAGSNACPFCGERAELEVAELWSDHSFMIEACCEASEMAWREELVDAAARPGYAAQLEIRAALSACAPWGVRRIADSQGQMLLAFDLALSDISFRDARAFVARHHQHCDPPVGWKFGQAVFNGPTLVGVAMVGRPVSRLLQTRANVLEVNRLCLNRELPDAIRANASSMLYGWAAREVRRRGYSRVITYLRADEDGHSLRASGWVPETTSRGGKWSRAGRHRADVNTVPKTRWGRSFL